MTDPEDMVAQWKKWKDEYADYMYDEVLNRMQRNANMLVTTVVYEGGEFKPKPLVRWVDNGTKITRMVIPEESYTGKFTFEDTKTDVYFINGKCVTKEEYAGFEQTEKFSSKLEDIINE